MIIERDLTPYVVYSGDPVLRALEKITANQARVIFRAIDAVVKRAGGSIKDVVTITVYLVDPRLLDPLMPIRREFWPEGNFPASTTITVHSLPAVGMMLEISAVAVVGDK